ncbi:hypothetical protein ATK78_0899 [Pedobacter metabolipauper]|uniref:Uncharacterized protein n=1 Tax=Pedobacter metabolipauper TaxID=425513 RepID=A0A4R6T322_9SPHI|nr:hypothetical protein ATK78_0899 [Pedobacter metabolipauper]
MFFINWGFTYSTISGTAHYIWWFIFIEEGYIAYLAFSQCTGILENTGRGINKVAYLEAKNLKLIKKPITPNKSN